MSILFREYQDDKMSNKPENYSLARGNENVMRMNMVRIDKEKLLAKIRENKEKHDKIYQEAVDGYWKTAKETLNDLQRKIDAKERIKDYLDLDYPENHAGDYEAAITKLEFASQTEVELTEAEFFQYVMNKWSWRESFISSNAKYSNSSVAAASSRF